MFCTMSDKMLSVTEVIYLMKPPKVKFNYSVLQNICTTLWI